MFLIEIHYWKTYSEVILNFQLTEVFYHSIVSLNTKDIFGEFLTVKWIFLNESVTIKLLNIYMVIFNTTIVYNFYSKKINKINLSN